MDFGKALEHLKAGKSVRRAQWPEDVNLRRVTRRGGKPGLLRGRELDSVEPADVFADDWTVVDDDNGLAR
jgi:hypothetical protein